MKDLTYTMINVLNNYALWVFNAFKMRLWTC